jgi:acetyl-CoA carboxylase biotin carboxylase subunit
MLKAFAGGGGRGMQIVRTPEELPSLFLQVQREAASFDCPDLYLDLVVKSQIRVAAGQRLTEFMRIPISARGHALECRINAENRDTFAPCAGRITGFNLPGGIGVRVACYDSLIAKLITFGRNRTDTIARMHRALKMFVVEGADPDFLAGKFHTNFVKRFMPGEGKP